MKKIYNIIRNKSYYHVYQASYICYLTQQIINKLFGKNIAKATSYKNKILKVKASNNFVATEIRFKQELILEQLNKNNNLKIKKINVI